MAAPIPARLPTPVTKAILPCSSFVLSMSISLARRESSLGEQPGATLSFVRPCHSSAPLGGQEGIAGAHGAAKFRGSSAALSGQRIHVPAVVALVGEEEVGTVFLKPFLPRGSGVVPGHFGRSVACKKRRGAQGVFAVTPQRGDGLVEKLDAVDGCNERTGVFVHFEFEVGAGMKIGAMLGVPAADIIATERFELLQRPVAQEPCGVAGVAFLAQPPVKVGARVSDRAAEDGRRDRDGPDRKSTRLNSSHGYIS